MFSGYGSRTIINIFIFFVYRRQIPTYKDGPRAERVLNQPTLSLVISKSDRQVR